MSPEARAYKNVYCVGLITHKTASVGAQSLVMRDGSEMDAWGTGLPSVERDNGPHPCKSTASGNEMRKVL